MDVKVVTCRRCGHRWPTKGKPKRCAACRTPYWRKSREGEDSTEAIRAVQAQAEEHNAALEELKLARLLYDAQQQAKTGVSALEWLRRVPESEWAPLKEALAAAERNLQALTVEEIAGIKKIYGFDPVLNPLHIVMHNAKKNLEGHGFYRPAGITPILEQCGGLAPASAPTSAPTSEGTHDSLVPPQTPPAPEDPAAVERQQLLDNAARLERIRSETEQRAAAQGLRGAVTSRSRF